MKRELKQIGRAVGVFMSLVALSLVPTATVYIDIVHISGRVKEVSLTEITQATLLLMIALIFWYGSYRRPNHRGGLALVAGFFTCALVRELDCFLDNVWHGFWIWPAITVALASISYVVVCCRNRVMGTLSNLVSERDFIFIMVGLVILLVFSRTFGSGTIVWKELMGRAYTSEFKSVLQEGLELYGYSFLFYGSLKFLFGGFDSLSSCIDRSKDTQIE